MIVSVGEGGGRPTRPLEGNRPSLQVDSRATRIRLEGGPMDGWLVQDDAPALEPNWYETWPPSVAEENEPGSYVLSASGDKAVWQSI
jgi:hypothetical protein